MQEDEDSYLRELFFKLQGMCNAVVNPVCDLHSYNEFNEPLRKSSVQEVSSMDSSISLSEIFCCERELNSDSTVHFTIRRSFIWE